MSRSEARIAPLKTLDYKLAIRLRKGKLRTCQSVHECCLCDLPITLGQRYYDAGLTARSHVGHLDGGCAENCTCAEG